MQGMSLLVAWITSDAKTELTENSSSLKQKLHVRFLKSIKTERKSNHPLKLYTIRQALPEVKDQTGHHPRLGGLPFSNVVEEQFTVRHHSKGSLPALLHPARLWDLKRQARVRNVGLK